MLTHLTDAISLFVTNLYMATGLLGIIIAMAIESCCIPLPSEIVMPVAGFLLYTHKLLPGVNFLLGLFLVALAGAIGCLLGSIVAYWIGYSGGRPLMLKYGRYVLISQHDADRADSFFQRWGSATTFFSRLLPVVRTYISLPAGIARMPFAKFCLYTILGSLPWCLLLAYLGTILGAHTSQLSTVFHSLDVVILVAVVALLALYIWRHIRNDRQAREQAAISNNGNTGLPTQPQGSHYQMPPSWTQAQGAPANWSQQAQQPQQFQRQIRNPQAPQAPQAPQPPQTQQFQQPSQQGWSGSTASPPRTPQQRWDASQPPPPMQSPRDAGSSWNQQPPYAPLPARPQPPYQPQDWSQLPPEPRPSSNGNHSHPES